MQSNSRPDDPQLFHAPQIGLYAIYLLFREAQLTDAMVDLLIETVHKIGTRSKRKVVSDIAKDIERVYGKERLLVEIASASIEEPSGRVCDVIFPIVGKDKLAAIVKESQAKGALDRRIYKVMRSSWANHYRRMLPSLLSVLEFRSNNTMWRPVLAALDWIRSKMDDGCRFVPVQDVPIDEVIPARWRSSVIDDDGRVNRISYELCVLTLLRDRIRSKEIWVVGADRYRNPDDDLPKDFEIRRDAYYSGLNLTPDARTFTSAICSELERELLLLNANIPDNDKVRLLWRGENRISITPFKPAPEPKGLDAIKGEIGGRWPMTGLLDVLKEAALDTGFLPEKPPSAAIALHLIIENFNKHGRGRKPARERIEAMLKRDYQMQKTGNCDYTLTITYDREPDGVSLDDEIENLQTEMFNIAESYRCSIEVDIHEIDGDERSW
nr:hypothetical protein [Mesorhizobium denitrificans]